MSTTMMKQRVTTFGREATDGLQPFASALGASPADPRTWLIMADWLDEEGHRNEAALVRSLWSDDAAPADGTIRRGYYQWENGGQHWCGVTVSCKDGQWHHCYWSNGNWQAACSRSQARELISSLGKPYRIEKRQRWTGEVEIIKGVTPYTGLSVEA